MGWYKVWRNSPKKVYILAKCGHETKIIDTVRAFGEKTKTEVLLVKGETEYCHKCLEKMAIRCAWCGRAIFIGDFITLYSSDGTYKLPADAVVYDKKQQLVGCQRTTCADSGADYGGKWMPPGIVQRRPSAIEIAIANPNDAVIRNGDKITIIKHRE